MINNWELRIKIEKYKRGIIQKSYDALSPRIKNYWIPWASANGKEKDLLRKEGRTPWA